MTKSEILGVVGVTTGTVALGCSLYLYRRACKAYEYLENGVDQISNNIEIDVPSQLVVDALDRAVQREVERKTSSVTRDVSYQFRTDLKKSVDTAISSSFSDIKQSVAKEVKSQVEDIDISDLKKEIRDEAKEKIIAKFDKDLDALLDDYNQNLANVSKIYNSIAETMNRKNETVLKIG